jgi:hypothetical protein
MEVVGGEREVIEERGGSGLRGMHGSVMGLAACCRDNAIEVRREQGDGDSA